MTMRNYKKKICVVSTSRADYGHLKGLIFKMNRSKKLNCHLSVTGSHLSKFHGNTFNEIISDNLKISSKIKILNSGHENNDISKAFSKGVFKYSKLFKRIKPQLVLILGDKFETLASVVSAMLSRIPICHLHGGEITEGAIDDAIRHSITKMSHIHFASNKQHQDRIIQMGENPNYVFNVGSVGLENIKNFNFKNKEYFKKKYQISFNKKTILISFHPVTLEPRSEKKHISSLLNALKYFKNYNLIFTAPNADHGHKIISKAIKSFVKINKNSFYVKSFGRDDFLSCLKYSQIIIGNSSSGIIEAPSLGTLTINLGNRQRGRLHAMSVVNCDLNSSMIKKKIELMLKKKIKNKKKFFKNPYYKKDTSNLMIKYLEKLNYENLIQKTFYKI